MTDTLSATEAELAVEQHHLDRVYTRLEAVKANAAEVRADGERRAELGNEGGLYERDVMVYEAARRLQALDSEYEGLVFGRLDLDGGEVRHIGRLGLRDEQFEPLVIDWRAPAAAAFYRATPTERMNVVRRRVISSSGPRVVGVEDDLLAPGEAPADMRIIGDGALLATLARGTGRAMRDIVATIQREQDQAVRAPASGVTVVSGGPGTGKTAVALHRIAYLLYQDRRRFTGGGVLLVGPSPVFMSYIGRVLPSLGEHTATLRSLGDVLDGVSAVRLDGPELAALKGSLRIRDLLVRAVRAEPPGAPASLRTVYRGEVLRLEAGALAKLRRRVHSRRTPVNAAGPIVVDELIGALWATAMSWADPPDWDRAAFERELRGRRELAEFVRSWWPRLTPAAVLGSLADPERLARAAGNRLSPDLVERLAASWAADAPSVQDVPILDELRVLLGEARRPGRHRRRPADEDEYRELATITDRQLTRQPWERPEHYDEYAHVVVDEAQDLSPMQWRMLGRRGRYASWTIVGDAAQSAWPDPDEAAQARDAALGARARHAYTLGTNYRNTAEIFDLAADVVRTAVPDADLPVAVRSSGRYPEHRLAPPDRPGPSPSRTTLPRAVRDAAAELLGRVEGTVGVISAMARRDEVAAWVAELPAQTGADPERLQAVGSLEAKGLEYDGVVVVEPAEILAESPTGVRTLYVVLSRATQELITVGADLSWLPESTAGADAGGNERRPA